MKLISNWKIKYPILFQINVGLGYHVKTALKEYINIRCTVHIDMPLGPVVQCSEL